MKHSVRYNVFVGALFGAAIACVPFVTRASTDDSSSMSLPPAPVASTIKAPMPTHTRALMPSAVRIGIIAGGGETTDTRWDNPAENQDSKDYFGETFVGFGRGRFSFETGVMYLRAPGIAVLTDTTKNQDSRVLYSSEFIGVPLVAKLNYVQEPLATFYGKAGVIPVQMINHSINDYAMPSGGRKSFAPVEQDQLITIGLGGTAPLDDTTTAFIIDLSGFYGITPTAGSHTQGVMLALGFSFDL